MTAPTRREARATASAAPRAGARAQYWAWRVAAVFVGVLPRRYAYALAGLIGRLGYYSWPRARRAMLRNYERVLPGASKRERARVARQSLANYCCYLVDFIRLPKMGPDEVVKRAGGREQFAKLRELTDSGRGVVIVCMHFGNWDLGAAAAAARGFDVSVLAESFADPRLDRAVFGAREGFGIKLVRMESPGPSLMRTLRRGGVVAVLLDRPVQGQGVAVRLFGEEVELPAGAARLAIATGAHVVVAGFPRKGGRGRVEVVADFRICTPAERTEESIQRLTQDLVLAHERIIRQYPEQWYMFRQMWPGREPQGAARR